MMGDLNRVKFHELIQKRINLKEKFKRSCLIIIGQSHISTYEENKYTLLLLYMNDEEKEMSGRSK